MIHDARDLIPSIHDSIQATSDVDRRRRLLSDVDPDALVIHRCDSGVDAETITAACCGDPLLVPLTGGQMPYTFVVRPDGCIEQALRLRDTGPHRRAWGVPAASVAVVGDFREGEPEPAQWFALLVLCHVLAPRLRRDGIIGHSELGDVPLRDDCPGQYLSLSRLRAEVEAADRARAGCAGVVF